MTRYLPVLGKDGISRYTLVDLGPGSAKHAHGRPVRATSGGVQHLRLTPTGRHA